VTARNFARTMTFTTPMEERYFEDYVPGAVHEFVSIAVAEAEESIGEVINIGSNYEISIGDTVELISQIMGADITIETDEIRIRPDKSEVERLWADNSKAEKLVAWKPAYGGKDGFKTGLTETVSWFMEPSNLVAYKADTYNV